MFFQKDNLGLIIYPFMQKGFFGVIIIIGQFYLDNGIWFHIRVDSFLPGMSSQGPLFPWPSVDGFNATSCLLWRASFTSSSLSLEVLGSISGETSGNEKEG